MYILSQVLIGFVAALHLFILWFEMFAWTTRGPKVFKSFPAEMFPKTKALAANQGLYNGFLTAGLVWSLCIGDPAWSSHVAVFFLGCVVVAGVYGAYSVQKTIFFTQALPALVALATVLLRA
jgi:putative membrane protein